MEVYFDNAATTRVDEEVVNLMNEVMLKDYGNPSSLHNFGINAEKYIRESAEIISKILRCKEKEILFTSGGTESNNMALIGSALANKRNGNHIIISKVEHASVGNVASFLESLGFEITKISVDGDGKINIDELKNAIRDDTILISIMMVNNEVGSIMPIEDIGKIIKELNETRRNKIIFHVDCIQAFAKLRIYPATLNIDLLSVSGHKFHGPKGSGFLYIKEKTKIKPIIYGGGQGGGMRSGTENVPAIAGIGLAAKKAYENFDEKINNLNSLKEYFMDRLLEIENVKLNSKKDGVCHIINASFIGIKSEVLLHTLEDNGIYVSSGSACSNNSKKEKSDTLFNMGLSDEELDSAIRFSLSRLTTKDEIDYTMEVLKANVALLRRFTKK